MNPRQKFPESFRAVSISRKPQAQSDISEPGGVAADTDGRIARLFIWGDIGGWWGVYGSDVYSQLKGESFDKIEVYVSSGGGSVFEAFEIYDLLKGHPAPVDVFIFSLAASAATIIAQAGDRVLMSEQAIFMIHYGALPLWGYYQAKDLLKEAEILSKFDNRIASLYVKSNRADLDEAEIRDLLDVETWFEPEEAKVAGFIDEVVPHVEVPFEDAQSSREEFESFFYQHTAAGTIKAAKDYEIRKIAASTFLPERLSLNKPINNKRTKADGPASPISNNSKFMNFPAKIAAWVASLGLKLQNEKGETLTEEQVLALASKDDNGAPEMIAEELRTQIVDLVNATVKENAPEVKATAGISEDKVAELLTPVLDRIEALEAKAETAPEKEEIEQAKSKLDEISARLQSVASRRSGGSRPNDPQNLDLGKESDPETAVRAFGAGSQVYQILVNSGKLNGQDVLDLEAKAAELRKKAGKTA